MTPPETSDQGNMVSQREGGWVLVPREPTARMLADAVMYAVAHEPSKADMAITGAVLEFLPPTGHPDARAVIAEIARDYRALLLSAPPAEPRADEGGVSGAERESSASPAHPMGEGQAGDGALYYAKGREVWKRPVATARPGGKSVALGFKVCAVADVVGEEGAATVAAMLTMAERYEERGAAREPMGCPLPGACACPAESDLSGRQGSEANTSEGTLPPAEQITQPSHDDEGLIERLNLLVGFHERNAAAASVSAPASTWSGIAKDLRQAANTISRLKGELDQAELERDDNRAEAKMWATDADKWQSRSLQLEAEVKELRSGLEPFADAGAQIPPPVSDGATCTYYRDSVFTAAHFRKARSLLSPAQEGLSSARASRDARSSTRPEGPCSDEGEA